MCRLWVICDALSIRVCLSICMFECVHMHVFVLVLAMWLPFSLGMQLSSSAQLKDSESSHVLGVGDSENQ